MTFPPSKEKRVLLEEFPLRTSGVMQAFVFNIRRDKFKDPRVRRPSTTRSTSRR